MSRHWFAVEKIGTGFLFLGDMDGLSLANGTENGEPRLRFIANSSDIRNRFLSDVRYTWDDDDCSTLDAWCFEDGSEDENMFPGSGWSGEVGDVCRKTHR